MGSNFEVGVFRTRIAEGTQAVTENQTRRSVSAGKHLFGHFLCDSHEPTQGVRGNWRVSVASGRTFGKELVLDHLHTTAVGGEARRATCEQPPAAQSCTSAAKCALREVLRASPEGPRSARLSRQTCCRSHRDHADTESCNVSHEERAAACDEAASA